MQITPKQIKLARIALDWTQPELADRAGVSKDTVVNLETGKKKTQQATYERIIDVLRAGGIEFTDGNGIRERQDYVVHYEGVEGFRDFMNDVYETAEEYGGDICVYNVTEKNWIKWMGEYEYSQHSKKMKNIKKKINFKIIVEEGDYFFIASEFAEYRWFPKNLFRRQSFYRYGPKLALIRFQPDKVNITVLNEGEFAESFGTLFEIAWNNVAIPPQEKTDGSS